MRIAINKGYVPFHEMLPVRAICSLTTTGGVLLRFGLWNGNRLRKVEGKSKIRTQACFAPPFRT